MNKPPKNQTYYYIEQYSEYSNCYFIFHASEPNGGKCYSLEECLETIQKLKLEKTRILKEEITYSYVN